MSTNKRYPENYDMLDTGNKLVMNLRDLGHVIRFLFEGKGSQKRILIILNEAGSMTQRELTERLGVQPGSASEVIGKLESAGLIQRTQSCEDHRTSEVRLTNAGREKADEAVKQRKQRHQEMFSGLSEEEKETLLALTEKLNADWRSRYHDYDKRLCRSEGHGKRHGCSDKFDRH
ncbi:MAG: MarR family winged helix-turn-helix transcriptional regulator [Ruminiclostridium sp.]